ncbi:MAG: hypothetical protein AAF650_08825 [Pseudomonadota bacterium]
MKERPSTRLASRALGVRRTPRGDEREIAFEDLSLGGCRVEDPAGRLGGWAAGRLGHWAIGRLGGWALATLSSSP